MPLTDGAAWCKPIAGSLMRSEAVLHIWLRSCIATCGGTIQAAACIKVVCICKRESTVYG
jgi:hypothetical protein